MEKKILNDEIKKLGLIDLWRDNMRSCSDTFGSPREFNVAVECFCNNLVDLQSGAKLRSLTKDYIEKEIKPWRDEQFYYWKSKNRSQAKIKALVIRTIREIKYESNKRLHHFLVQLLVDNIDITEEIKDE